MLIWEHNDGTFEFLPLVTSRSNIDAALDNRESQEEERGKEEESAGTTPASDSRTSTPDRSTQYDGWRREGHSQR